jgi:MFS family permease
MNVNGITPEGEAPYERRAPLSGARPALALLLTINLFNYIDRYVLAAVERHIEKDLLPNDPYPATKMGALSFAFLISYMFFSPLFGWLGDRTSRWWIIGVGVIVWSLASGASGLATVFLVLAVTRCLVGIGEAAYGPVAPTLLSDYYPVKIRGTVLAWFYSALPVGSALGYVLGGQVAAVINWRWAFYLVVPPGILLGIWCFWMREPTRGQADAAPAVRSSPNRLRDYKILFRIPSYVFNTLGMTAMTFAMGGLAYWMPRYLADNGAPSWGPIVPDTIFGGLTALAGFLATLTGGFVGDKLRDRYPGSYFWVSGITMILGFPMVLLVLWTPFPWAWVLIFLAVFTLFFNTGPTNTILANVAPPAMRATAFAVNIFVIHALGDAISPTVIGYLKDVTGSLSPGFVLVSIMMVGGGILWLMGARHLERDTKLAPTRSL